MFGSTVSGLEMLGLLFTGWVLLPALVLGQFEAALKDRKAISRNVRE